MESDLCSSFLFGRIFCDEPASTLSENALDAVQSQRERLQLASLAIWVQQSPKRFALSL